MFYVQQCCSINHIFMFVMPFWLNVKKLADQLIVSINLQGHSSDVLLVLANHSSEIRL